MQDDTSFDYLITGRGLGGSVAALRLFGTPAGDNHHIPLPDLPSAASATARGADGGHLSVENNALLPGKVDWPDSPARVIELVFADGRA